MRRAIVFGYGMLAYLGFLAVFGYTIGFVAGIGVPKGIDDGPTGPMWLALVVDAGLLGLFAVGWIVLVLSTFLLGHFDLFGLRQVLARARKVDYSEPGFSQPLFYRVVRHPIMVGFLIAFWAAPDMSRGRLLFAVATTGYILIAVRLEERDLRRRLGDDYLAYERRVPRFIPRLHGAREGA